MDTQILECLVAISEHRSLTEAAKSLHVSQPTLSRYLAQASKEIGTPLFERSRSLTLTPAGRLYIESAKKIIAVKTHTYALIESMCGTNDEHVKLGISSHTGAEMFASIYDRFQYDHPHVKLDPIEGYSLDLLNMVDDGRLDLAEGIWAEGFTPKENVEFWAVNKLPHLMAISENNVLADGGASSAEEEVPVVPYAYFKDVPAVNPNLRALGHQVEVYLQNKTDVTPLTFCRTSNYHLSIQMATVFNGCCLLPERLCKEHLGLKYFKTDPPAMVTKGFYIRRNLELTPAIKELLYLCASVMLRRNNISLTAAETTMHPELREIMFVNGGPANV